jgi:hypothetical protein
MPKNALEVTLVPNNLSFLKILNFVQSFGEFKVSLADGSLGSSQSESSSWKKSKE